MATLPRLQECEVVVGTLSDFDPRDNFDIVLYLDVLEHIEDDAAELAHATQHLKPNGTLVVVDPALPWLFTPFDTAIGHYRRYTRNSLRAIAPHGLHEEKCIYLDAIGLLASAENRLILRSAIPSVSQIRFWDRFLVPISRFADGALSYSLGRSVLAIWRKTA